ncbi:MAG: hypothetical protein EBV23_10025 [Flavobacteriia bacterium]|nr:hypothetical protein [Flavobacteriia bacterium]
MDKQNESKGTKVASKNRKEMNREYLKKVLGISKLYPEPGWEEALKTQAVYTTGVSFSGGR